jgi:periplasmic protein TonB
MFADSLIDSNWAQTSRRGWTTIASFALQAAVVGMLLMLPLIYTEGLPQLKLLASPGMVAPAPPPGPPPEISPARRSEAPVSNLQDGVLMGITRIPRAIPAIDDGGIAPSDNAPDWTVIGSTGINRSGPGVPFALNGNSNWVPPAPKPVGHAPLRLSNVMQGYLVHKVEPTYPALARTARIQGSVELRAIISKEGTIENLRVVSGHPMLAQAALEAVRQWRYRPYILNGEPMEVDTQVTVNFVLSGN